MATLRFAVFAVLVSCAPLFAQVSATVSLSAAVIAEAEPVLIRVELANATANALEIPELWTGLRVEREVTPGVFEEFQFGRLERHAELDAVAAGATVAAETIAPSHVVTSVGVYRLGLSILLVDPAGVIVEVDSGWTSLAVNASVPNADALAAVAPTDSSPDAFGAVTRLYESALTLRRLGPPIELARLQAALGVPGVSARLLSLLNAQLAQHAISDDDMPTLLSIAQTELASNPPGNDCGSWLGLWTYLESHALWRQAPTVAQFDQVTANYQAFESAHPFMASVYAYPGPPLWIRSSLQ